MPKTKSINSVPEIKRDENGLKLGINYNYLPNGKIDWFNLIDKEHWVPNPDWFKKRGKEIPETAEGLEKEQVYIKLKGYLELLDLRGYKSLEFKPVVASQEYVSTVCRITFIPNYETENQEIIFEQIADAHAGNTENGVHYLSATAANRAMSLAIRKFLGIEIASDEEVGHEETETPTAFHDPVKKLKNLAKKLNLSLEEIRDNANKERSIPKRFTWETWDDVKSNEALKLIKVLSNTKS